MVGLLWSAAGVSLDMYQEHLEERLSVVGRHCEPDGSSMDIVVVSTECRVALLSGDGGERERGVEGGIRRVERGKGRREDGLEHDAWVDRGRTPRGGVFQIPMPMLNNPAEVITPPNQRQPVA